VEAACPGAVQARAKRAGLEYILSYQTRGDFIGEIGVLQNRPRSATCVAYVHPEPGQGHKGPTAKWRKEEPLVELVRIPGETLKGLLEESPTLQQKLKAVAVQREQKDVKRRSLATWDEGGEVQLSRQFEELGLLQGQKLMLIDLDRCTRCDECVRACVNTHDDGRSRLFLDGPRFGKYLVPTTCRSCLDPVCMIGCPVGSIHRGDNRQMVIEDWCIGCGLCATNCPYGSIQMHDIGIIPEGAHGWRFYPAWAVGGARWMRRGYGDGDWLAGRTPFRLDADFKERLRAQGVEAPAGNDGALCFRYSFNLDGAVLRSAQEFALEATSTDGPLGVWVNGVELVTAEKPRRGKRTYVLNAAEGPLRAGHNVVAVRVTPTPKDLELLLELRLDEVRRPTVPPGLEGDISEKLVTQLAVVCDLCSQQFGQRPACVTACPHDAAMRVNARFEFPAW
jgi:Fe-S-cluster-containing hydrogenase component 2